VSCTHGALAKCDDGVALLRFENLPASLLMALIVKLLMLSTVVSSREV
jgi:hypothetical protein